MELKWIEWNGGERPVPNGHDVSVQFRDGVVRRDKLPEVWGWKHHYGDNDIVRYYDHTQAIMDAWEKAPDNATHVCKNTGDFWKKENDEYRCFAPNLKCWLLPEQFNCDTEGVDLVERPQASAAEHPTPKTVASKADLELGGIWADFFLKTWPNGCTDKEIMASWFANAMIAKVDSMTDSTTVAEEKAEWNGEGLPPIGYTHLQLEKPIGWFESDFKVVNHVDGLIDEDGSEYEIAILCSSQGYVMPFLIGELKPIKSQAEKEREEAENEIYEFMLDSCQAADKKLAISSWLKN